MSISKNYQDEVWCDVLPMDACHNLLGRPWMYDIRILHNGFLNTYSFEKGGKKIKLLPMLPSQIFHAMRPKNYKGENNVLTLNGATNLCHIDLKRKLHEEDKAFKKTKVAYKVTNNYMSPYYEANDLLNLRTNSFQQGEDDENTRPRFGLVIKQTLEECKEALDDQQGAQ